MNSDDIDRIAALVAAQLDRFAEEQKAARDEMYGVIAGLAQATKATATAVVDLGTRTDPNSAASMKSLVADVIAQVVPAIASAMPQQQAKSAMSQPQLDALVTALHEVMQTRMAPIVARLDAAERRLPGRDR